MKRHGNLLICMIAMLSVCRIAYAADTLSVMIVATPAAIAGMGGPQQTSTKVFTDINNINQSFVNSRIDGYVRVVRTDLLNLVEQGCLYDMLNNVMTVREGELERLNQMRSDYGADIVIVIVDEPSQCGIAGAYGNPAQSYMLLHYECLGANYSMARQLGYLLGCGNNESQSGRFNIYSKEAYAYYYDNEEDIVGESFSTIMGYTDERLSANEVDFDMIPYWSSADTINVRYHNKRVGDKTHDNAGQIKLALPAVCNYKFSYEMLRLPTTLLRAYDKIRLETKRTLELDDVNVEPQGDAAFESKRTRLSKNVQIKRGAKVRITSY